MMANFETDSESEDNSCTFSVDELYLNVTANNSKPKITPREKLLSNVKNPNLHYEINKVNKNVTSSKISVTNTDETHFEVDELNDFNIVNINNIEVFEFNDNLININLNAETLVNENGKSSDTELEGEYDKDSFVDQNNIQNYVKDLDVVSFDNEVQNVKIKEQKQTRLLKKVIKFCC